MTQRTMKTGFAAFLLAGVIAAATPAHARVFNDVFIFGDSYSDTGASFPLTNGTTAAAYMAALYGIPLTTSKNPTPGTQGVNFAESGARVDVGPTPPAVNPRSLTQQVGLFQSYVTSGRVTFNPESTLFFLSGGLNDHTRATRAEIEAATIDQVTTLVGLGARYFELALLPSLVPAFTDSAVNLNPEFRVLVPMLQSLFPQAIFKLSNWGPFFDDIIVNPSKYGITNTTDQCYNLTTMRQECTDPDQYFYYYIVHPSNRAHRIVGAQLFAEALAIPEPATAGLLGIGLAGLLVLRLRRRR